ncbi:MAG: hypothetical protein ABI813_15600 [Bacteroidota bacterium]
MEFGHKDKDWLDHGLQQLYIFMHMHDEVISPGFTEDMVNKLNKACGLHLKKPQIVQTVF